MIFEKIRDVKSPVRANDTDSWIDFFIPDDDIEIYIEPWQSCLIPLAIRVRLPEWYDMIFFNKSGIASKTWLIVWACVIDNWFRGELMLNLINTSKETRTLFAWQKIVQWVIRKCEYINPIEWNVDFDTSRWQWGFGSTGLFN